MHAWDKSLTEDYTVKVILPEGAHNIKLELPFHVTGAEISMEKYFGTLDFFGRPAIRINKSNAVHDICDGLIRVKYDFDNSTQLLIEPIQLTGLIFIIFLTLIFLNNTGFDLESKKEKEE
jgi:oligosaccharyltransferase complex subunit alpha (ribophorin I)